MTKTTSLTSGNRNALEQRATKRHSHLSPEVGHDNEHDKVA